MREAHHLVLGELAMTERAAVERGREAELADEAPGGGERAPGDRVVRGDADRVEPDGERVVDRAPFVLGGEAHAELAERGRCGEALERRCQLGARARRVEARQRVEVATGVDGEMRHPAREEIEPLPETALGPFGPARDHAHHARLARRQADDARGLAIVEPVQDDRRGLDHLCNLSPA